MLPAVLVASGVLVPILYLLTRAFDAESADLGAILFRRRNLELFLNTILLTGGVLLTTSLIAFPLAWLTGRTDLRGRRAITILSILPLAIPGYVMAYTLLGAGGSYGMLHQLFGINIPRPSGYWGALLSISLYTFPYLFLNLRAALLGMDSSQEDAARSLGYRRAEIYFRVILPQLTPAFCAGSLIIGLYVLGDFGAVSLMRYETFSYAIFLQYSASFDRIYAAWLALMLLVLTGSVLYLEARLLKGVAFHRIGTGANRVLHPVPLGIWKAPAYLFIGALFLVSLFLPVFSLFFWMGSFLSPDSWTGVWSSFLDSFSASLPAAFLAGALGLPIAYIGVRYPSGITRFLERTAYFGYAIPPLTLALALVVFSLNILPFLYQSLLLLICAYTLHFMAEAVGPIRSSLYQASPRLEEAARSMGCNPLTAFFQAIFPLLRRGLVVGTAFVFLSAMKELPLTFLLSPIGFNTLAINVWSYATEAMFAEAAPYALTLLLFSTLFVGLLLAREGKR